MRNVSRVRDLMATEVVTLRQNDKLSIADDIMRLGRIRHIPILDDDERERVRINIHRHRYHGGTARQLRKRGQAEQKKKNAISDKEIRSDAVDTVDSGAALDEAASLMMEKKIGCLVVTQDGRLAGILTESDFVRLHAEADVAPAAGPKGSAQ